MSDFDLRDILAVAVVKERKRRAEEIKTWKNRALNAEKELMQLKADVETQVSPEALLRRFGELDVHVVDTQPMRSLINDEQKRRIALFLRNVHALRTAQALRNSGKINGFEESATLDLVCDFVRGSMLELAPGTLRTSYVHHAAEFFAVILQESTEESLSGTAEREKTRKEIEDLISFMMERITRSSTDHGCVTIEDHLATESLEHVDVIIDKSKTAAIEFLTILLDNPFCLHRILCQTAERIAMVISDVAQSARRLQETKRHLLTVEQCEAFVFQKEEACSTTQMLFTLQEKALEKIVALFASCSDEINVPVEWAEHVVRNAMHAQQFVEILEIFSPELTSDLYLSTAIVIVALQKISSEKAPSTEGRLHQENCLQLCRSIREFYMPTSWT